MRAPAVTGGKATILHGACEAHLGTLADASIDAVVTDPPAGIGFMGKTWDSDKGGRDQWIAWLAGVMRECLRVLRPGGYALVWALPRTSHWTATAIEDAGFEIRDVHHHIFGTGFPKSLDVAKAFDAAGGVSPADQAALLRTKREGAGLTRQQLAEMVECTESSIRDWEDGRARRAGGAIEHMIPSKAYRSKLAEILGYTDDERLVIGVAADRRRDGSVYGVGHSGTLRASGATSAARRWKGHGTALKPAVEHWILARKPLDGTYAENVLEHGTGALNIDACRIGTSKDITTGNRGTKERETGWGMRNEEATSGLDPNIGRWPAHLSLEHADGCLEVSAPMLTVHTGLAAVARLNAVADGAGPLEARTVWQCVDGCPVRTLDEQSGERRSGSLAAGTARGVNSVFGKSPAGAATTRDIEASSGGASRFFYTLGSEPGFRYIAKPARSEKDRGLEDLPAIDGGAATGRTEGSAGLKSPRAGSGRNGGGRNTHPTVKAVALMRWLVRLITPPGGLVLDPFAGSGTTGIACAEEGLRFIGIEQDEKHHDTARLRLRKAYGAAEVATELPAQRDLAAVLIAQPKGGDA